MYSSGSGPSGKRDTTRADQEYLELLAKEFNSIPDRDVQSEEPQDDEQLAAMNRMFETLFPLLILVGSLTLTSDCRNKYHQSKTRQGKRRSAQCSDRKDYPLSHGRHEHWAVIF